MVKVYLAGKFEDRERIHKLMGELWAAGYVVTMDWTTHLIDDEEAKKKWAVLDIGGVKECDVLIAMLDLPFSYKGLFCELGAALALGKIVIVVGEYEKACCFLYHPSVVWRPTFEGAMVYLKEVKRGEI